MTAAATPGREALRGQIAQALCCQGDCIRGEDACWKYTISGHKKITDAIVAIFDSLAAKPADKWQDISTAPKDGVGFLACIGIWITVCCWHKHRQCWVAVGPSYSSYAADEQPTHWQPLPAPPPDNSLTDPSTIGFAG